MGLFKKPNRKFRQRVAHTDSEDEETQNQELDKKQKDSKTPNNSSNDIKDKSKVFSKGGTSKEAGDKTDAQPIIPAAKLLSFHDEEDDGEVFKLKKSNYSRRLTKQLERERKKRQEAPAASTSSTNQIPDQKPEKKDDEKPTKSSGDIYSGKEAEDMDVDDDDDEDDNDAQINNPFKDVLQSGVIPDAATIYAMKKHRQLAREMKDFIPLEQEEKEEESQSRLVREDDNDRSDDDEDDEPSRLSFNVNSSAVERQKVREAFLSLQDESQEDLENEDAAELERWEREQIRKGVSIVQSIPTQSQQVPEGDYYSAYLPSTVNEPQSLYPQTTIKDVDSNDKSFLKAFQENPKSNLTTDVIKARLQERLTSLKEVHEARNKELEDVRKEIDRNTELVEKYEKEAPENAARFQLYQQLRGYVRDLVECLDMKVAHVDLLETRMMDLYKERAKALIARRQQDVKDQADEYYDLSCKVSKGNVSDISNEKSNCQDEAKLRRAAEREGRRIRRRKKRECTVLPAKHHDGMSSDDEEFKSEIIEFNEKKESFIEESKTVFDDVVDEFGTLEGLMSNFGKWKKEQSTSYNDAFVPLCLPKIFAPFVRMELLGWNPLEEDLDIEDTQWFKSLACYGMQQIEQNEDVCNEDDSDMNLLPTIVEKTIIPKITAFIKDVWDPTSSKQTTNLINLIKKLNEEYLTTTGKSKQIQTMLQSVCTRIKTSLDEDVYIPLYPKELLENRSMGSSIFFQRQFWFTVKLLKNIISWDGIVAEEPLQDMSLPSLLNRYLLMGLNSSLILRDSVEKSKVIVKSFPKHWFSQEKRPKTSSLLKQFSQYLVKFAQQLSLPPTIKEDEEDDKLIVIEVVQLLIIMSSFEEAVILAKQYNISGFKKDES